MKKVLTITDAQQLSKSEQAKVYGGKVPVGGCPGSLEWNPVERCCYNYSTGVCC